MQTLPHIIGYAVNNLTRKGPSNFTLLTMGIVTSFSVLKSKINVVKYDHVCIKLIVGRQAVRKSAVARNRYASDRNLRKESVKCREGRLHIYSSVV